MSAKTAFLSKLASPAEKSKSSSMPFWASGGCCEGSFPDQRVRKERAHRRLDVRESSWVYRFATGSRLVGDAGRGRSASVPSGHGSRVKVRATQVGAGSAGGHALAGSGSESRRMLSDPDEQLESSALGRTAEPERRGLRPYRNSVRLASPLYAE